MSLKRNRNPDLAWITQDELRALLTYNPETGAFTRNTSRAGRGMKYSVGDPVGTLGKRGYLRTNIGDRHYVMHRLAWLYVHGVWPNAALDHINGIKTDNRLANLRDVPETMNALNIHAPRPSNKLGIRGVSMSYGKFVAFISCRKRTYFLGAFTNADDAESAYLTAKRGFFPDVQP